jgi:GR25 family glycosyltransferase involved in LPS biosynthesis
MLDSVDRIQAQKIPTFIISLPGDEANYRSVAAQLDSHIFETRRVIGFPGRTLPDTVCIKLTRDPNSVNNKGALGCMFSHIHAWECIKGLNTPFALVLEDDVVADRPERLGSLDVPEQFDLLFCNDRMVLGVIDGEARPIGRVGDSLAKVERQKQGVGTDAYLISPMGAQMLLSYFQTDFYFGHVDIRLFAYCIDSTTLDGANGPVARELLAIRKIIANRKPLAGYVSNYTLFTHMTANSRRMKEDRSRNENIHLPMIGGE